MEGNTGPGEEKAEEAPAPPAHVLTEQAGYKGNQLCMLENTSDLNFILNFVCLIC